MGGKSSKSTSQVTIPQEVLARYNSVNAQAQQAAATPFQQYSTDPSAFVAPLNSQQNAGISGINSAANMAQPYFNAATGQLISSQGSAQGYYDSAGNLINQGVGAGAGLAGAALGSTQSAQGVGNALGSQAYGALQQAGSAAAPLQSQAAGNYNTALHQGQAGTMMAGQGLGAAYSGAQPYNQVATGLAAGSAQAVNADQLNPTQYMSPYVNQVLGSTAALLNQQNQQQQSGQMGQAIQSGAFGGDRAGIAAANLSQQQQLANASIYSGILDKAYGQSLATGQQQQGVNLGAGQANRAALGSAAGQIAGIGAQQFGQGNQTAMDYSQLAQQLYGQGLGAGSAQASLGNQVYGQGANTSGQLASLGQQQFGQGLSAAQMQAGLGSQLSGLGLSAAGAQQGLGQAQYATGAGTAEALANIGQGAQGAALQGAQAQLGAGTLGQQTSQAGLSALYNQFLQQQSYPFQVSQFLANIAEGTGSLSGSTTTSTQPGGFFSDERLKEDIKPVGKTYDGQNIYSYRYKGEPKTQIGLLAQEVEGKHPHAVGLDSGFKTVDYGKATSSASERGHFAGGGTIPGITPESMAAILQAQQGMYAPFSQSGGLYGGSSSAGLYGGQGHVPASSVPVANLAVAAPPPKPASVAEHVHNAVQMGQDGQQAYKAGKGIWDAGKSLYDNYSGKRAAAALDDIPLTQTSTSDYTPDTNFGDQSSWDWARGGRIGLASGGMPYATTGAGLDIPDNTPGGKLQPGQAPGQAQSGFSQAVGLAGDVGKILSLFRDGGRVGRAYGGGLDIPDESPHARLVVAQPPKDDQKSGSDGLGSLLDIGQKGMDLYSKFGSGAGSSGGASGLSGGSADALGGVGGGSSIGSVLGSTGGMAALMALPLALRIANGPPDSPDYSPGAPVYTGAHGMRTAHPIKAAGGRIGKDGGGAMDWDPDPSEYNPRAGVIDRSPRAPVADVPRGTSVPFDSSIVGSFVKSPVGQALAGTGEALGRFATDTVPNLVYNGGALLQNTGAELWGGPKASYVNPFTDPSVLRGLGAGSSAPPSPAPAPSTAAVSAPRPGLAAPATDLAFTRNPSTGLSPALARAAGDASAAYQASPGLAPAQLQSPAPTAPAAFTPPSGGLAPTAGVPDASGKDSKGHFADVMDTLKKGLSASGLDKKENLIPLLTGIAAMGTAPTRSLGVALAAGVGAGAQAYQPTQESISGVRNMDAGTFAIANEQAMKNGMVILADRSRMLIGQYRGLLAQGRAPKTMADVIGNRATGQPPASPSDTAVTAAQAAIGAIPKSPEGHDYVQNAGARQIDQDYQRLSQMENPQSWANEREISVRAEAALTANADSARRMGGTLNQLSPTLMSMPDTGLNSGHYADLKVGLASRADDIVKTIAGTLGVPVPQNLLIGKFDPNDPLALAAASKKLSGLLQFAQASGADQESLGALRTAAETVPRDSLTKNQARVVLAGLYVDKQRALDTNQYMNEYKGNVQARHPGQGDLYLAHSALNASRQDLPEQQYARAKDLITAALPSIPQILKDPDAASKLDAIGEKNGVHHFSRFFMNQ